MNNILKKLFKKNPQNSSTKKSSEESKLPKEITKKKEILGSYIKKNSDIISRSFILNGDENYQALILYLDGIVDINILNRDILKPLMTSCIPEQLKSQGTQPLINQIWGTSLTVGQVKKIDTFQSLVQKLFDGNAVLIFDGVKEALGLDIRGGEYRAIEEPATEKTLRGSREGFTENLITCIALIRRKLRDPKLVVEKQVVGKRTRTDVAIIYIEDIADPRIVAEVKKRINLIDIDGAMETGYLEQMIEDNPYSPFPQMQGTERPDKIVGNLLEGRIAILANGSPFALIVPSLFIQFLQASEDYYERAYVGSVYRLLRTMAFFLAISLPAIYVAVLSFQQELIPLDLIIPLAENRKQVPFPVAVEAFLLELIIQVVIETGLRLPTAIGQTVGVVGGIVLGQTAVTANLASPAIIIIVALTTICTFAMASYGLAAAIRVIGLPLFFLSAAFGVFGFSLGWLLILAHLVSLESMGVPYFAPIAPMRFTDLKDTFIRVFAFWMKKRPVSIPGQDKKRLKRRKE